MVIPITLLEEIDKFKRGQRDNQLQRPGVLPRARRPHRDGLLSDGVALEGGGVIAVDTDIRKDESLRGIFWEDSPDHRILSLAYNLAREYGRDRVILVSKDINLRMKAKSIGVQRRGLRDREGRRTSTSCTPARTWWRACPAEIIDAIYQRRCDRPARRRPRASEPFPNEYFIMRNGTKSTLTAYVKESRSLRLVEKKRAYGIQPRNAEQTFSLDALMNPASAW